MKAVCSRPAGCPITIPWQCPEKQCAQIKLVWALLSLFVFIVSKKISNQYFQMEICVTPASSGRLIDGVILAIDVQVWGGVFLSCPQAVQSPDVDLILYECCMKLF